MRETPSNNPKPTKETKQKATGIPRNPQQRPSKGGSKLNKNPFHRAGDQPGPTCFRKFKEMLAWPRAASRHLKKHNKQRPVQQPMEINKLGNKDKQPKCPSKGTQTLSTVFMQGGQGLVKEPLYKVSSQNLCRESSQTISVQDLRTISLRRIFEKVPYLQELCKRNVLHTLPRAPLHNGPAHKPSHTHNLSGRPLRKTASHRFIRSAWGIWKNSVSQISVTIEDLFGSLFQDNVNDLCLGSLKEVPWNKELCTHGLARAL